MNIQSWKFSLPAALLSALSMLAPAYAAPAQYALSPDGNTVVRIISQTNAPALDTNLVTAQYAGWTVSKDAALNGGFVTSQYAPGWSGGSGGAQFQGSYAQAQAVGAGHQLNFIQVISTNKPLGGPNSPYIDPRPNDDNLPFYWTAAEAAAKSTSKSVSFSDFSKRPPDNLKAIGSINWSAALYPVDYDGATTVKVGNGVQWGWEMKQATVGHAAGTFNGPVPGCPPATCTGIGGSSITWGQGSPGGLSFMGAAFAPQVGDPFKIGTLSYTNGSTVSGTALDGISLDIALSFDNVSELNFTYHAGMSINNTPNTSDPVASADFVKFAAGSFHNSFNVLEGASASADLMARLTPVLKVNPGLAGDKDPFGFPDGLSLIGYDLELVALANPTAGGFVTGVPLPGTMSLLAIGWLALLIGRRRKIQLNR